jgi:uncharacterized protein
VTGESLLVTLGKVGLGVVVVVPLLVYFAQDALIFYRQPLSEARRAEVAKRFPAVKEILLDTADGTKLHAWHVAGAGPTVLYFGGNAEEVSWMLDELPRRDTGAAWLLIDYRGYGASDGAPSEQALTSDALAWYDRFAATNARIVAFGRSLGSGVAVRLAAERRLDAVVLLAPFDSLREVAQRYYPYLPVRLLLRHPFDSMSHAPRLTAPLLCLVATDDEVIPVEHARRLYQAWGGPKRWVELAAGHNDIHNHPDYWPSIRAFLAAR